LRGDALRLRQLCAILVDNASSTPRPMAMSRSAWRPPPAGIADVDDDVPGIPPRSLPRVFDRFWRPSDAPDGGAGWVSPSRLDRGPHGGRHPRP